MHRNRSVKQRAWALSLRLLVLPRLNNTNAQLLEKTDQLGNQPGFSYAVTTTYGTNINIDASPNVIANAEATLVIEIL